MTMIRMTMYVEVAEEIDTFDALKIAEEVALQSVNAVDEVVDAVVVSATVSNGDSK